MGVSVTAGSRSGSLPTECLLLTTPDLFYECIYLTWSVFRKLNSLLEEKAIGDEVSMDDRITGGSKEQAIGRKILEASRNHTALLLWLP